MRETCKIHFNWLCACIVVLQICYSVCGDGVSTWTKFHGHIKHWCPVICKSGSPLWSGFVVVYRLTALYINVLTDYCMY